MTVRQAFDSLRVPWFIGGSVASSWHGATRSTMDVDLVADLNDSHVSPLSKKLGGEYYASEPAIRSEIVCKSCFNLIHLSTSFDGNTRVRMIGPVWEYLLTERQSVLPRLPRKARKALNELVDSSEIGDYFLANSGKMNKGCDSGISV